MTLMATYKLEHPAAVAPLVEQPRTQVEMEDVEAAAVAVVVTDAAATARGARTVIASWVKRIVLISIDGVRFSSRNGSSLETH